VVSVVLDRGRDSAFDEDLVLVERFLRGDQTGFELLYKKYYDKVFALCRGILMDQEEAADAVQEVFTLVYRHLPRFDRRSKFSTWLFRIAVNRSIQEARKARFRTKPVELTEDIGQVTIEQPDSSDPAIQTALAKLSPPDRALIALFYWEELSLQEIADSLNCGVNAAKTRLYRARERFRVFYEEASGE